MCSTMLRNLGESVARPGCNNRHLAVARLAIRTWFPIFPYLSIPIFPTSRLAQLKPSLHSLWTASLVGYRVKTKSVSRVKWPWTLFTNFLFVLYPTNCYTVYMYWWLLCYVYRDQKCCSNSWSFIHICDHAVHYGYYLSLVGKFVLVTAVVWCYVSYGCTSVLILYSLSCF